MKHEQALADPFIERVRASLSGRTRAESAADPGVTRAAVALLLRLPDDGSHEVLLIRRAEFEGDPWSGHVALPGGRQEEQDSDLECTAVRETFEEIALDIAQHGRVLGSLNDVRPVSPRLPRILIRPFVAVVDDSVKLELSAEVASAFWVPLSQLRDPSSRASSVIRASNETFGVKGYQLGEHFVWGLTERILREFLEIGYERAG